MTQLYESHGKDCEQRVSNAACRATGLKWSQIYKWLYDYHQQKLNKENFISGKPARVLNISRDFAKRMEGKKFAVVKIAKADGSSQTMRDCQSLRVWAIYAAGNSHAIR